MKKEEAVQDNQRTFVKLIRKTTGSPPPGSLSPPPPSDCKRPPGWVRATLPPAWLFLARQITISPNNNCRFICSIASKGTSL
ncbi:hypothetical protein DFAR_1470002 [Desulfarculales bacterium]